MFSIRIGSFLQVFILFMVEIGLHYLFPQQAPALVLLAVTFFAFHEGAGFGALTGLWAGFLLDLFGLGKPGLFMTVFSCYGLVAGFFSTKVFQDSFFAERVMPFAGLLFILLVEARTVAALTEGDWHARSITELWMPWRVLATVLVSPWIFQLLLRFHPKKVRRLRGAY